jgi:hypothetical protein
MLCTSKLHPLPIDFGDQIRLENLHDIILNNKEPQQCLHHMGPLRRRYNLLVDRAEMSVLPLVHQIVAQTLVVRLIHLDALLTEAQLHAHRAAAATATCCRLRGGRIFDGTRMAHLQRYAISNRKKTIIITITNSNSNYNIFIFSSNNSNNNNKT